MTFESITFGERQSFAIELHLYFDDANPCIGAKFFYWVVGARFGGQEPAYIDDLDASYGYLARGTINMDEQILFNCERGALARRLAKILQDGALSDSTLDSIFRCNLWFHQALGDIRIIAPASGDQVRIFGLVDDFNAIAFDVVMPRKSVDAVLIEAGVHLAAKANELLKGDIP